MLKKIISAGDVRKSRFHTESDVFIGMGSVAGQIPAVVFQKAAAILTGRRPSKPWWPLPAIRAVEARLHDGINAIEFGTGSSTIWLAKRVANVVAREHDEEWSKITKNRITEQGLTNVDLQYRGDHSYFALNDDDLFDFAVVDGAYRWKCLETLKEHMKPGGFIYFDNSDSDKDAKHYSEFDISGKHHAQRVVRDLISEGTVRSSIEFHGMIHGELFAGSGMIIEFN
ncbi:MAG: hypothetical protein AAFR36_30080 [Bacteroidota bacterium]